jgi:hypothetical protein
MKLWELTKLIRSKNAGPFELTFDVIFKDREGYEKVRNAKLISAEWFAKTYRPAISGDIDDTDVYGGQQHGPLVDVDVP